MTMTSWPYTDQATTDIEYGRLYHEMAGTMGVVGSLGDNELETYGDSSGLQVKLKSGAAIVRGYMFYSDAEEVLAISAPGASTRYDRVVLELNLSEPAVADRIVPKVLVGTVGAGSPPALTQDITGVWQIPLATVQVDNGASSIDAADVTTERAYVGHKVGVWTGNSGRPASPRKYQLGFNEASGGYEYWNGTAWVNLGAVNLASSLVTGTLPISKGGTGQTSAMAALNALGIYIQETEPAYAAYRAWIKVPS